MKKLSDHIVIIRFKVNKTIASGHMDNAINFYKFFKEKFNYDVFLVLNSDENYFEHFMIDQKLNFIHEKNLSKLLDKIESKNYKYKTFMNDTLRTSVNLASKLKKLNYKIVLCEEYSSSTNHADLVLNPIYKKSTSHSYEYNGPEYFLLRDEFIKEMSKIKKSHKQPFLITFGGVDKTFISERIYNYLKDTDYNFYLLKPKFRDLSIKNLDDKRIILDSGINIAKLINNSKFVVSSSGRTVYETAYLQKTSLVISQNLRECSHYTNSLSSVTYIGYQRYLTENKFLNNLEIHLENLKKNKIKTKKIVNKLDSILTKTFPV